MVSTGNAIAVCPECLGGLSTPSLPAERKANIVVNKDNSDVTAEFYKGANEVLKIAQENKCKLAILKSKSPSYGHCLIYDGNFSGKIINGYGVTTELILKSDIQVISENELDTIEL